MNVLSNSLKAWLNAGLGLLYPEICQLCGGERATFNRIRPLLAILSDDGKLLRYVGPAGQAARVKALVNMVMNINTAGLAEGLALADALGLDLTMIREIFSQTTGRTCRTASTPAISAPPTPPRTAASRWAWRSRRG